MITKPPPPSIPTTVGDAIEYCAQRLARSDATYGHGTDNPWDEAVQLVLHVANLPGGSSAQVASQSLTGAQQSHMLDLLKRRITQAIPLPYLLGRAWFAGLEFLCDERALVPRSPIAELVRNDFQPWYAGPPPTHLLDLCCGGGCIGLAAAHYNSEARVDLVDIDPQALDLARANAAHLGVAERVNIVQSNAFQALGEQRYDLVLCNPPYVDREALASMPSEYWHEPHLGLASGEDGLDLTRQILRAVGDYLNPAGLLVLEVGLSWPALERAYPEVPFTWVEFEHGGEGVFVLTAREWQDYGAHWV